MPILCPRSSLWRFGKRARRGNGGRRSKAIKSSAASRKVNTKGTLAHPFVTKQVNPAPLMMSPGSTGGVYLGPTKEEKTSAPAASRQEKKLAEIRSPTEYYTGGTPIIDQDESTTQSKREDGKLEARPGQSRPLSVATESRYNDTLNPDGANASIVFFEETFMSKFSHLSTSSPQYAARRIRNTPLSPKASSRRTDAQDDAPLSPKFAARSGVPRSPEVTKARTDVQNKAPLTPSKRTREDMESDQEDEVVEACIESTALLTSLKEPSSSARGHNRKHRNVIPSWVRQRRCLPTIDDVDFDMIDVISLHSLTPNESRTSVFSSPKAIEDRKDISQSRDSQARIEENDIPHNNNYLTPEKNMRDNSQVIRRDKEPKMKDKLEVRSVLRDLTNTPTSQDKDRAKSDKTRVSFRISKRSSTGEKRSRRNRPSGSRKPRSYSREDLISAMQRVSDHNYVNLEFIASVTTDSPPSDCGFEDDDDDHDYVQLLPRSPPKTAKITKGSLSPGKGSPKGTQKETSVKTVTFMDDPRRQIQLEKNRRRRSERIYRQNENAKLTTLLEDSDLGNLDECLPLTGERCKPASSVRRSLPVARSFLTVREGNQNESHTRKQLFGAPLEGSRSKNNLTSNDKPLSIPSTASYGEDVMSTQRNPTPPNLATVHDNKSEKSPYTSLSENDSLLYADGFVRGGKTDSYAQSCDTDGSVRQKCAPVQNQTIASVKTDQVHTNQEPKCLIKNPAYTDNSIRKARIVRTNSMEESQSNTLPRRIKADKETGERHDTLERNKQKPREVRERPSTLERQKQTTGEDGKVLRPNVEDKGGVFTPRKSRHNETRRSLPAPASAKMVSAQMTPQRRSTTNVRTVQAKLSKKQNRKIRRTVEGDEIMEAIAGPGEAKSGKIHEGAQVIETQIHGRCFPEDGDNLSAERTIPSKNPGGHTHETQGDSRVVLGLGDCPEKDSVTRVQKIISDWNQTSKRIVSAHRSTHYVGTHLHAIPDSVARKDGRGVLVSNKQNNRHKIPNSISHRHARRNSNSRKDELVILNPISNNDRHTTPDSNSHEEGCAREENFKYKEPTAKQRPLGTVVTRRKGDRANRENIARDQSLQPSEVVRKEVDAQSVEVSHSAIRRIPMVASNANVTTNRRSVTPSVIEIYIASQPYSPHEVDEIDVQEGEILVVNSSMQRETDWMWIYAPRSDRFGYIPAFAARPLEFQQSPV